MDMFDLPDAKRVRRSDLYTRSSSSSPEPSSPIDPDASARFHEQLASLYGTIPTQSYATEDALKPEFNNDVPDLPPPEDEQDQEEEFDFRLFSNDNEGKIVLKEEVPDKGVFIVKERNQKYYFTGPIGGKRKEEFASAAVSGEDVLQGKEQRYWGWEVPWRVRVLKVGFAGQKSVGNNGLGVGNNSSHGDKRRKLGKRMRIILRERKRKSDAQQEAMTKEKESKEEADRERKARKNREKKERRKAKEKALKATAGGIDQIGRGVEEEDD